jgi:cytochrome c biogenesis protein CcmG/thiol:disulfide interchange protein DsbE
MEEQTPQASQRNSLPVWVQALALVVLLAFLTLIGFSLKRTQQGPITIGQTVPAFTLTTFDGEVFNTADMKGKVVVINFWASWCFPCKQEAADLESAWRQLSSDGDVVFLGVDYVDTEPEARAYLSEFDITYPNGPDLATKISQMFRIRGVPETYIISPDGKLVDVKIGPYSSLTEILDAIDKAKTGSVN